MRIPKGGIAFFDSGIGGLTVLNECQKLFPEQVFYYYGDNRHAPYGNLSKRKIQKYTVRAFRYFHRLRARVAVIACNTVTAVCIDGLRKEFTFPIIGTEPALLPAIKRGTKVVVVVLATKATCESERFIALRSRAERINPSARITVCSCARLAGEIEFAIGKKIKANPFKVNDEKKRGGGISYSLPKVEGADVVVLGCTHYGYIKREIQAFYGCEIVDGNEGIVRRLKMVLEGGLEGEIASRPPVDPLRPQGRKNREKSPSITTSTPLKWFVKKFKRNANKCSCLKYKNARKQKGCSVFFLGSGKQKNRKIWEQMFGF